MKVESLRTLNYVVLPCSDLAMMRRFYSDTLGLAATYERADWIEFKLENLTLALRPSSGAFFTRSETDPQRTAVQLAFRVPDSEVDQWFHELSDLEVLILDPPRDQTWGHRTLYFKDPEGNLVEIFADLAQDGSG